MPKLRKDFMDNLTSKNPLSAAIEARFEAWCAKEHLCRGATPVSFRYLLKSFADFLGPELTTTPHMLGKLLGKRFFKRQTRAHGADSDIIYLLNRTPCRGRVPRGSAEDELSA